MIRLAFTLFLLFSPASALAADATYPVTVPDKYRDALAERTKTVNLMRARATKSGTAPVALTPQQVLQRIVEDQLEQLDAQLLATESSKPWAEKSPRAKARHCAELKMTPEDCAKIGGQ